MQLVVPVDSLCMFSRSFVGIKKLLALIESAEQVCVCVCVCVDFVYLLSLNYLIF